MLSLHLRQVDLCRKLFLRQGLVDAALQTAAGGVHRIARHQRQVIQAAIIAPVCVRNDFRN